MLGNRRVQYSRLDGLEASKVATIHDPPFHSQSSYWAVVYDVDLSVQVSTL